MLEFSEMMLETWLQLGLQLYLIYYYYYGVRFASLSQALSLLKSFFILIPLTLKALMPENIFTKDPQETWITAITRMVWVTFLYYTTFSVLSVSMANCITSLENPASIWILSSSAFISGFFIVMSFRESGYGRLKCYMVCLLFLQIAILWTWILVTMALQRASFVLDYLEHSSYVMLSILIVVIFLKAANSIKNVHGNIRFIQENPDYMILDDFEMISRVITSIGLKSNSKLPNIYFCSLIMMTFLLVIGTITGAVSSAMDFFYQIAK